MSKKMLQPGIPTDEQRDPLANQAEAENKERNLKFKELAEVIGSLVQSMVKLTEESWKTLAEIEQTSREQGELFSKRIEKATQVWIETTKEAQKAADNLDHSTKAAEQAAEKLSQTTKTAIHKTLSLATAFVMNRTQKKH